MTHTDNAAKTITKATPTVDLDGKVTKWEVSLEYSLNDYISTFTREAEVDPTKAPEEFTKAELLSLIDVDFLDTVYESQYASTQISVPVTETKVDEFDVDSLA
jgi:hypothetical protein